MGPNLSGAPGASLDIIKVWMGAAGARDTARSLSFFSCSAHRLCTRRRRCRAQQVMDGTLKSGAIGLFMGMVDVRDVALGHILAFEKESAQVCAEESVYASSM